MREGWYVARHQRKAGPFSWAQMQALAASGKLRPSDQVLKPGASDWARADSIARLFPPRPEAAPAIGAVSFPTPDDSREPSAIAPPTRSPKAVTGLPGGVRRWALALGLGGAAIILALVGAWVFRGAAPADDQEVSPAQASAAQLLKSPATSVLPAKYVTLARLISNLYSTDAATPVGNTAVTETVDLDAALKDLATAKSPAIRAAVERLQAGGQRASETVKGFQSAKAKAGQLEKELVEGAARGDFVEHSPPRVTTNLMPDFSEGAEEFSGRVIPLMGALAVHKYAAGLPAAARTAAAEVMEQARLEAWSELLPKVGDFYPKSPARGNLVTLRVTAPDTEGDRPGTVAIVNTSGGLLADVTLTVDMVHFRRLPHAGYRQVLFVQRWPADKAIYLSTSVPTNVRPPRGVTTLNTSQLFGDDRWYANAGGVVEARLTAWAAEAHQPEETVKLADQATKTARYVLNAAYRQLQDHVMDLIEKEAKARSRPTARPSRPASKTAKTSAESAPAPQSLPLLPPADHKAKKPPLAFYAEAAAQQMALLLPNSELAAEAKALADDPEGYVRQRRQRDLNALAKIAADGEGWTGEWRFQPKRVAPPKPNSSFIPIPGAQPPTLTAAVKQALSEGKGAKGIVALAFDSFDPKTYAVAGRLYDPERPSLSRPLTGNIRSDNDKAKQLVLWLTTPKSAKETKPVCLDFHETALLLSIECDENGLTGTAVASEDRYHDLYHFDLVLRRAGPDVPKPGKE